MEEVETQYDSRAAADSAGRGLRGRSYWALIATQFLGAFNDNAYKMVVLLFVSAGMLSTKGGAKYTSGATATFAVAFILFSSVAGYLADRFSKRTIIVLSKVAEIGAMGLAFFALMAGDRVTPIIVLFLMAVQSTFFSPAKYGILPEILDDEELSQGNGIVNMTTYLGIILGTLTGGWLISLFGEAVTQDGQRTYQGPIENTALVLVGIAVLGTITSLFVGKVPAAGIQRKPRWNFLADSWAGIRRVRKDKPLFLAMLANMYVWVFGAVFIQNFTPYGWEILKVERGETISNLIGLLCVGIAIGSVLAGKLSGRHIEFGLVPFGAIGMTLGSLAFVLTSLPESLSTRLWLTGGNLLLLGVFLGFYFVPLNAYIQQRSPKNAKGDNIGVLNFITFTGILAGAAGVYVLSDTLKLNPAAIFAAFGLITIGVTAYICTMLPDFLVRFVVWLATRTVYRFRVVGIENVPKEGPALLVCNHVSMVDAALVMACFQRFVRFLMYREYYDHPLLHWGARLMRAIPISYKDGPRAIAEALREARRALVEDGDLVCIFAEGSVTRTGNLRGFRPGLEHIVKGTNVPVIPVHLDRVWGSIFSFERGRVFWKFPRALPYPVTVSFGKPMPAASTAHEVRTAVAELGAEAFRFRRGAQVLLHHAFIRAAKINWLKPCVADSSGLKMRYGRLLIASMALSRRIRRLARASRGTAGASAEAIADSHRQACPVFDPEAQTRRERSRRDARATPEYVGLMLPSSVPAAVANLATLFAGKVPVNLNFTASREAIESAVEQCGMKTILTSRRFLEKAGIEPMPGMVMLEDVAAQITRWRKVQAALAGFLLPAWVLRRLYSRRGLRPEDTATVIFTSGTTGRPKGVVLSHRNLAANIVGFCQILSFKPDDCMCGVLPLFHSFGYTATLWAPILRYFRVVYHPNPLDARTIGRLVREHGATHLISTPTFLRAYVRKCEPEDFRSLTTVVVGAEKMKKEIADEFEKRFGLRPLEGYGCTELSPVAAVNVPDVPAGEGAQVGTKEGTIGQPLPNVAARVVGIETGRPLPAGEEGMLEIKGPSVMTGYLNDPGKTAEVIHDGWYRTGDVAHIDADGFITITDRLSRFSKVGGEMVPHMAVEDAICRILGAGPGETACVVTSVPDEQKGERLAVLHTKLPISIDELWRKLNEESASCSAGAAGLPRLWIPKREMFHEVDEIPVTASGKIALSKVKQMAAEIWEREQ